MDISAEKYKADGNRPVSFFAALQAVKGFIKRLTEFLTFTEEDRLAAGIYLGRNGPD